MITHAPSPSRPAGISPAIYRENRRYVLGVLARRCRWLDSSRREDVLHDAYLVLLEKLKNGSLDGAGMADAQVRAYLTQAAINKALDQGKRAGRRRSVSLDREDCAELRSPGPAIEEHVVVREDARRLQDAVMMLPERRRKVVKLRCFLGCEPGEVQARLGVSRDVYRHELERGTRAVAQALAA